MKMYKVFCFAFNGIWVVYSNPDIFAVLTFALFRNNFTAVVIY